MQKSYNKVNEYDGYTVPERGKDTPENRALREKAMKEFMEKARKNMENDEK